MDIMLDVILAVGIVAVGVVALAVIGVAAYAACAFTGALLERAGRWTDNWVSAVLCEINFIAQKIRR